MGKGDNKDRRQRFWRLLASGARRTLARRYNYTCEPITTEGPCLIISNHVTNSDPFLVGLAHANEPLTFVASEHIFRQGLTSKLITKLLDPIPRSKAASGAGTVKSCLRRIKDGEAVALFAEGDCTWDGLSAGIFPATGKLAKACGVPLVTFRIEGGYPTRPRWSKHSRRGKMRGGPVRVYGVEELKAMTPEEVTAAIDRDIFEDAWARLRGEPVRYIGKKKAEGLERGFYICPKCGGMRLSSKGDELRCADCGLVCTVLDNAEFAFEPPVGIKNAADWDILQRERMEGILKGELEEPEADEVECLFTNVGTDEKQKARLAVDIAKRRLRVTFGGYEQSFVFSDISDMSMVKTNRLLFTSGEGYYELKCKRGCLRRALNAWQAAKRLGL